MQDTGGMADALNTLESAIAGITALIEGGDPTVIVNAIVQATDLAEQAAIASALTLMASAALLEIDRLAGDGAGMAWLRAEALRMQRDA